MGPGVGTTGNDGILIANNIAPKFNVEGNVDYRSPGPILGPSFP